MKRTNKFLSVILSILMIMSIVPLPARAAEPTSGTCGENIIWEFDDETGVLTISGTGDMYDYKGYYTSRIVAMSFCEPRSCPSLLSS